MPTGQAVDNSRPNTGRSVEAGTYVYRPGGCNSRPLAGQLRKEYIITVQKVGNNRHVMAGRLETGMSLIGQSVEAAI